MSYTTKHTAELDAYRYQIGKLQAALTRRKRGVRILRDKLHAAEQERDSAVATARRWRQIAKANMVDFPLAAE